MLGYERWWTRHRLAPQFDALGPEPMITQPWNVEVTGAGVHAGRRLHALPSRDLPIRLTTWPGPGVRASITIGDCVLLTGGARVLAAQEIVIGDGCMLARGATVTDCDWHGLYDRVGATQDARPTRLGRNVWLADGAFVGKGVTIGDNAIVAARAVVLDDVPANTVVAGAPARPVKTLDPDQPIKTRLDLYADEDATDRYLDAAWAELNAGNTFIGWLRSRLLPARGD